MKLPWQRRSAVDAMVLVWAIACLAVCRGDAAEPALLGNQSCATSTCHGGAIGSGPSWHFSLSTWMANDPHAGAGLLLRDADSRRIVTRLDPAATDSIEAYDNVLRTRCISCHTTVASEQTEAVGRLEDTVLAAGVSCESCHGPAEKWITAHVQGNWQGEQRFAPETGMRDTESIVGRSETCVRCHIGSRTSDGMIRDMNHDLIAAGHPALRFDLLLYEQNLPSHWDPQSPAEVAFNESAIRVRDVGRAINLSAALQLSAERAVDHLQSKEAGGLASVPWPELADYDCFACHQSLAFTPAESPEVSSGVPVWNAWHTIRQLAISDRAMSSLSPRHNDPRRTAQLIPPKAEEWRANAISLSQQTVTPSERLNEILRELDETAGIDWQQAAIQYLRLDAAQRDLAKNPATDPIAQQLGAALGQIETLLRFDPQRPRDQRAKYHSPKSFDATKFREAVRAALQPLSEATGAAHSIQIPLSRSVASQP